MNEAEKALVGAKGKGALVGRVFDFWLDRAEVDPDGVLEVLPHLARAPVFVGSASAAGDPTRMLTAEQKSVADQLGLSFEEFAEQLAAERRERLAAHSAGQVATEAGGLTDEQRSVADQLGLSQEEFAEALEEHRP